jgi:hypothetical protein
MRRHALLLRRNTEPSADVGALFDCDGRPQRLVRRRRVSDSEALSFSPLSLPLLHMLSFPPILHMPRSRLGIADIPDDETARHHFRFTRPQLSRLLPLLRLPPTISTRNRYVATAEEALLIVLFRLAFPSRLADRVFKEWFNRSAPEICELFNTTCNQLWNAWHRRVRCC